MGERPPGRPDALPARRRRHLLGEAPRGVHEGGVRRGPRCARAEKMERFVGVERPELDRGLEPSPATAPRRPATPSAATPRSRSRAAPVEPPRAVRCAAHRRRAADDASGGKTQIFDPSHGPTARWQAKLQPSEAARATERCRLHDGEPNTRVPAPCGQPASTEAPTRRSPARARQWHGGQPMRARRHAATVDAPKDRCPRARPCR